MSTTLSHRQLARKRQSDKRIDELAHAMDIAEARAEAKAEGVVQGRTEGEIETLKRAALGMLKAGATRELVCTALEITEAQLNELLATPNPKDN